MIEYTVQLACRVIFQCFLSAYGLLAYVLVLKPLIKFRRSSFSQPFYTVCLALALLDILNLVDRICLLVSDPLLQYTSPFILQLRSFYERFLHYGIACIELLIALERALVVFAPVDGKLVVSNGFALISLAFFTICILATNFCVFTSICPYVWYPNTTTVFVDQSVPSAVLHNKVVDLALQPILLGVTLLSYFVTGFKVLKARQKIQSQQLLAPAVRKYKLEHLLVLQGIIITIPRAIVVIVYHVIFYSQSLPFWVQTVLDFILQIVFVFGSCLNPILLLILNKDLRRKAIETWCSIQHTNTFQFNSKGISNKTPSNQAFNSSVNHRIKGKFCKPGTSVSRH